MIYRPKAIAEMWDSWVVYHEDRYYLYLVTASSEGVEYWDGFTLCTSVDGVHWEEVGEILHVADDAYWLGGLATIWSIETEDQAGRAQRKFITSFSEFRGENKEEDQQTLFFAESTDLVHWKRLGNEYEFKPDPRWYKVDQGCKSRWDGLCVIPRPEGGWYGYLTACSNEPNLPACTDGSTLTFGMAQSHDGLHWEALPVPRIDWNGMLDAKTTTNPPENIFRAISVGDIEHIDGKYYLLNTTTAVLVSESPFGPFHPQPVNQPLIPERAGEGNRFPRLCRTADGLLYVHHDKTSAGVTFAPMKRAFVDNDGILRLKYWEGNEALKGERIDLCPPKDGGVFFEPCLDVSVGVILEGKMEFGKEKCGLLIECLTDQTVAILTSESGITEYGPFEKELACINAQEIERFDRGLGNLASAAWRLLLRLDKAEFYLNDVFIQSIRLPGNATGSIGLVPTSADRQSCKTDCWQMSLESAASSSANELQRGGVDGI